MQEQAEVDIKGMIEMALNDPLISGGGKKKGI